MLMFLLVSFLKIVVFCRRSLFFIGLVFLYALLEVSLRRGYPHPFIYYLS